MTTILFFDERWNIRSETFSYGHDIEAVWLIQEAAEIINHEALVQQCKVVAIKLANAATEESNGNVLTENMQ